MTAIQNRRNSRQRENEEDADVRQAFQLLINTDMVASQSKPQVESSVESISPELAKVYLATQKINRTPTVSRIRDYADRMIRGEWKVSQPIQFTTEGDLFDGQHRLMAVIRSGVTCDFLVIRGLPPETRYYVDIGQPRRTAQVAELMGLGSSLNSKLATCKAMFLGQDLKPKNQKAEAQSKKIGQAGAASLVFSPHKLIELYLKYQESIDFANQFTAPATAPVRAVIARAWHHENHIRLQQFITVVNTGYPITDYDEAAIALRNVLLVLRAEKRTGLAQKPVIYKKTIAALAHFMANRNIRFIKEKETELYPLPDFD